MSTLYEPKLHMLADELRPDQFLYTEGARPCETMVVSRRLDGSTASVYGDLVWDLTAYHPERRPTTLNFKFWECDEPNTAQRELMNEIKWIMFSLMWRWPGAPLGLGTLDNYGVSLRALASFADARNIRLHALLLSGPLLLEFATSSPSNRARVGALTGKLARLGFEIVGDSVRAKLSVLQRNYAETLKQVSPMPTRVYSSVLTLLARELSDWEEVEAAFLNLANQLADEPSLGRSFHVQWKVGKRTGAWDGKTQETFMLVANRYGVVPYLTNKECSLSVKGLNAALVEVQLVAKLTVQAFTGMRDDEAQSLPYDCLEVVRSKGDDHYVVHGRTTKFNHGLAKAARWVTNAEGARAIRTAQRIADAVYARQPGAPAEKRLLFVNPRYLGLYGKVKVLNDGGRARKLELAEQQRLRARLQPVIEEGDLRELEQIDPHRAWRSEERFTVGLQWHLVSHQFRRALALYAHRSGLVSLPALRRQLQHITEEMSRYYARGSAFAKDFLGDDTEHFGYEWQATQPESSALGYIFSVLMAGAAMTGGHGAWVQHRMRDEHGTVLFDRDKTVKMFKRGELAYRETLLGGCTNTGACDQRAFDWLDADCLAGCQHMVVKLPNVERVIAALSRHVSNLDETSLEYRTQSGYLTMLTAAKNKLQQLEGMPNE